MEIRNRLTAAYSNLSICKFLKHYPTIWTTARHFIMAGKKKVIIMALVKIKTPMHDWHKKR